MIGTENVEPNSKIVEFHLDAISKVWDVNPINNYNYEFWITNDYDILHSSYTPEDNNDPETQ